MQRQKKNSMTLLKWIGYFFLGMDRHGWSVFQNFKQFGTRDVSVKKADAFVKSVQLEEEGEITIPQEEIISFSEQIVYRTVECRECLENSKCEFCTCEFPSKMQTPDQTCPSGEWSEIMTPTDWDEYKKQQQIKFKTK